MSETLNLSNTDPANTPPRVIGELYPDDYRELQEHAAWRQENTTRLQSRLGEAPLPDAPQVDAVHVFSDREGQHFVVSHGPNMGDRVSERGAARLGLATPSEELEKLQSRKDMNREEWSYFSTMADNLSLATANGASSEDIDAQAQDILYKFNVSADTHYYSPALRGAFNLLYLGARRDKADSLTALGDALAVGYLSNEDQGILSDVVNEIERFKKMDGFSQESIEQQLVQSTAANIAYRHEDSASKELRVLLNAYALGVASRSPQESGYYRQQLEQLITD